MRVICRCGQVKNGTTIRLTGITCQAQLFAVGRSGVSWMTPGNMQQMRVRMNRVFAGMASPISQDSFGVLHGYPLTLANGFSRRLETRMAVHFMGRHNAQT
jgi:hypothetical protein